MDSDRRNNLLEVRGTRRAAFTDAVTFRARIEHFGILERVLKLRVLV
jgi:hypothetical protein